MAFTKTPTEQTEKTVFVPLMHEWNTRNISNAKDVDNVNCLFEPVRNQATGDNYYEILKRDGIKISTSTGLPPSEIYGAYYWASRGSGAGTPTPWYVVIGAFGVRAYGVNWNLEASPAFAFQNTTIGVAEFLFDTGDSALFITDGTNAALFYSFGNIVAVPAAPSPHRPYPVFLDGYLFLADIYTGSIYNSQLNDPTVWPAGNVITAESYPDKVLALARSGQYVVALGGASVQYFYDAANPTGTPLAAQTTVLQIGFLGGLVSYKEDLYFIGTSRNGVANLYSITGLKATALSDVSYTRWADTIPSTSTNVTTDNMLGFILVLNGHACYTTNNLGTSPANPNLTYVYDLDTQLWSRLSYQNGTNMDLRSACTTIYGPSGLRSVVTFRGSTGIFEFNADTYQDVGVNYTVSFITPNLDFGTYRKKFGSRIMVHADQTSSASNAFISWSDDDYQSFSTPRAINMAGQYKQVFRLGSFRKRAFKFTYSDNFPMRWETLELDYSQGSS